MVLSALILRLVIVSLVFRDVAAPTIDHEQFGWEMGWTARSIALGHGFGSPFLPWTGPTALVPPLYPYLLALIFRIFGLYSASSALVTLSLNSLFSALTCIPVYFSTRNAISERAANLAGWAWVIYPFSVYFSADRVWDYALTALLFCCCFWAVQNLHQRSKLIAWLGFGALVGITALSNPSVLSTVPFLLAIALWKVRRAGGRWLLHGLVVAIGVAAIATPWAVRNESVLHSTSLIRDGFWLEFWAGNSGDTSDSNPPWAHPASNPVEMQKYQSLGEINYLAQKHDLAMAFISRHPFFFVEVSLRRVVRFWTGFWSASSTYLHSQPLDIPNFFFCTALSVLMIRGARRWWQTDRAGVLPYMCLIALFPLPYYLTHSSMDYRQPIEPEVITLVIVGIFGLRRTNSAAEDGTLNADTNSTEEPVLATS